MAHGDVDIDNDEEGTSSSRGFMSRQSIIGFVAGLAGFILIALTVPHSDPVQHAVMAKVEAPAPAAEKPAEPAQTTAAVAAPAEAGPAPSADVPIAAEAAVVITDAGLSRRVASALDAQLPREATLAVSPYATDPAGTAAAFKTSGRDVWLQIAAQSVKGGIDPGPLAVAASLGAKENGDLIQRQLNIAGGNVIGIFIPDDADVTLNQDAWREAAENLIGANHMILDATPAKVATSLYMQKSESQISAYLKADVVVSAANGPSDFQAALEAAIPTILKQQQAIMVVSGLTAPSVDVLSAWVKTLAMHGIRLVPASQFTGLTQ